MHILLIDDSASTRSLLRTLINSDKAARHEISEAASGEESLQKVGSGEIRLPDLIIMDINMGGMSGYELCREFRQRHGGASDLVPYIIIVTANEGVDVINQALDCGANDYMPKPVNVKVLQVRLRVAERLLSQAQASPPPAPAAPTPAQIPAPAITPVPTPASDSNSGGGSFDPRQAIIVEAISQTDAPIAIIEAGTIDSTFTIVYANAAMTVSTQFSEDQLIGKSLAELEAWTPDFIKMTLGYVEQGNILSHVPLWSHTRQDVPVHLSFYPIRSADEQVRHYLVIHHL
ncbi:MAG TPA: response regulator [Candidatus Methylacidiphilales bacterium]|nr:response regulator [Candidatus Methylacidiphilales bacterium]